MEQVGETLSRTVTCHAAAAGVLSEPLRETHALLVLERLRERVQQAERRVATEVAVWRGDGSDVARVQVARQVCDLARQQLADAERIAEAQRVEREREVERERLRLLRAPPDLQALVKQHTAWHLIPAAAWAAFDQAMAVWRERLRSGDLYRRRYRDQ